MSNSLKKFFLLFTLLFCFSVLAFNVAGNYIENANKSEIIVIATTIEEDTDFGYDKFKLEIHEVLKGVDILKNKFGEIPKTFHYIGEKDIAGQTDPVIGVKGIYFFYHTQNINKDSLWLQKIPESTIYLIEETKAIYEKGYKPHLDAIWYRNEIKNNKSLSKDKIKAFKRWADGFEKIGKMPETFDEVINNIKKAVKANGRVDFNEVKEN